MHIYNENSIRKHIERQLVAQFDKFVKNTILTVGKPPQRKVRKLIKSLSTNRTLTKSRSKSVKRPKEKKFKKLEKRKKQKLARESSVSKSSKNREPKIDSHTKPHPNLEIDIPLSENGNPFSSLLFR